MFFESLLLRPVKAADSRVATRFRPGLWTDATCSDQQPQVPQGAVRPPPRAHNPPPAPGQLHGPTAPEGEAGRGGDTCSRPCPPGTAVVLIRPS
ncbi:hypothetical protein MDA_GLEAN10010382 [Myotis davidii]|uniref:Uncharacterized protein n=1 Tax=Myotis davidii TaxID=225400 RepID=L5MGX5_MYODS|nr:hypothetical protein MDA_GLEAN10010382 [Myotis davidii]